MSRGRRLDWGEIVRQFSAALIVTLMLGGFFSWVVELSHPATVLALVIVYFAFNDGLAAGLAAAIATIAWSVYATFHTVKPVFFPTESVQRLATVIIAMPVLAVVVARLRLLGRDTENELRAANAALRALINASPLGIYTLDSAGRVRSWNPAAEKIFGWSESEVLGLMPPSVPGGGLEEYRTLLERVMGGETVHRARLARKRRDDTIIIVDLSAAPLFDARRVVTAILVLVRDVTNEEMAEEALRRQTSLLKSQSDALQASEGSYRMLLEQAADGIFIVDLQTGTFVTVNTRGCEMLGYTLNELKQMSPVDLLRDEDVDHSGERLTMLRAGQTLLSERQLQRKDGRFIPVEISTKLLPDGRLQAIVRDITARRLSEETLRETDAQLRQAQKMEAIGRLAGGVAHDFNNLLTAIQGHTHMMLEDLRAGDPNYAGLSAIQNATERAASLTRQLLAFSRKQVLQPKVLGLNSVVRDITTMLHRLIGENIKLYVSLESGLGKVLADPGQVQQVLLNLVVNARDAMPEGGTITIETRNVTLDDNYVRNHPGARAGSYVAMSVSDTGTGMAPETLAHVFEPFFTTKPPGSGTGLGLATVYGIVKQSDGYIWAESELRKGTTFTVYLPRVESNMPESGLESDLRPSREALAGSETVLLVEDEESVRDLVQRVLGRRGYKVLTATNGMDAIGVSGEYEDEIDLLITDVVMPEMGGRDLARSLAASRPGIRILYMSGYSEEAVAQHGMLEFGTDFLEKPFTPDVLVKKVRQVLDSETNSTTDPIE